MQHGGLVADGGLMVMFACVAEVAGCTTGLVGFVAGMIRCQTGLVGGSSS